MEKQYLFRDYLKISSQWNSSHKPLANDQAAITVGVIFLLGALTLVYLVFNLFLGFFSMASINGAYLMVVLLPSSLLLKLNRVFVSKVYLSSLTIIYFLSLGLMAYSEGRFIETENAVLIYFIAILILFDGRTKFIFFLLGIALIIVLKIVKFKLSNLPIDLSLFLTLTNIGSVLFALYLLIGFFKGRLYSAQNELSRANEDLKEQNNEVATQNELLNSQQNELELSKRMLRGAIDHIPIFIALLDTKGYYLVANAQYQEAFMKPLNEIEGAHYSSILSKPLLEIHEPLVEKGMLGELVDFDHETELPNGKKLYSYGKYVPIFGEEGEVLFLSVFVVDITLLKETEKRLTEINLTKDKLFSIIGHDLRSPLASLNSLIDLAQADYIDQKEFKEFVGNISQNLGNVSNLLNNLLHWAKSQMGAYTPQKEMLSIVPIINRNISLCSEAAKNKNININFHVEVEVMAFADDRMLDVVIRNLLSNAIKFTNEGGQIHVLLTPENDHIWISIQDNGMGLKQEEMNRILQSEIFTRKGTQKELGSGLGLLLCREFVQKNGGQLKIKSVLGEGSTFSFSLKTQID